MRPFSPAALLLSSVMLASPVLPAQADATVEELFDACAGPEPAAARARRALLERQGEASAVLARHLTEDEDWERRRLAASLMGRLGEAAVPDLDALLEAIHDSEKQVSRAAFHALAEVAPWLTDRNAREAVADAVVAAKYGPDKLKWLNRKTAMRPYFRLAVDPHAGVEELRELLSPQTKPYVLEYVCILLKRRGEAAKPAVPGLLDVLEADRLSNNANLRHSGPGVHVTVRSRVDLQREIRRAAAEAIVAAGSESEATAKALLHLLQVEYGGDPKAQVHAVMALGRLGAKAKPALPMLIELLTASAPRVRWEAATALGMMGQAAGPAVDALRAAATSEDPQLAKRAAASLQRIEGGR